MAWTDRFITDTGAGAHDGTSEANAWTIAEAIAAPYGGGARLNIKAGTHAQTTNPRTFAVAGATGTPVWLRGYNTTPGDLDTSHSLALPAITFTTGNMVVSGAFHYLSNLDINSAAVTGTNPGTLSVTGASCKTWRCKLENTAANANSFAYRSNTANLLAGCWLKVTSSASVVSSSGAASVYFGNVFRGGGVGLLHVSTGIIASNVFDDIGGIAISLDTSGTFCIGNSVYSAGSDGIRVASTSAAILIANNILDSCGGYGINFSSGANGASWLVANRFRNNTSGNVNNCTEGAAITDDLLVHLLNGAETSIPWVDAGNHDFDLLSTALSKATGFPGTFENEAAYAGFLDAGAVQRAEAGTNVTMFRGGFTGGMQVSK